MRALILAVALISSSLLTACGNTTQSAAPARTAPSASPVPTYRDFSATMRAVIHDVASAQECTNIGHRAHVVTVTIDLGGGAPSRALGIPSARCIREVRPGDSAYTHASTATIFLPHLHVMRDANETFALVQRPAATAATCIAAGEHAHVPTVAYLERPSDVLMFYARGPQLICMRLVATDDSAADSAAQSVVTVPARELTP
jgi:hypothetical protein